MFNRLRRRALYSVFRRIFKALGVDIDCDCVMIDATIFPGRQLGQGMRGETTNQIIGHSCDSAATKMLELADTTGGLFKSRFAPVQANELMAAPDLLMGLCADALPRGRAFDGGWVREEIEEL